MFNSAAFSPDGKSVIAASDDTTVWIWRDLRPLAGPDDRRLWTATSYCPSIEERKRLLDVTEEMARADFERCQRRVREFGEDHR